MADRPASHPPEIPQEEPSPQSRVRSRPGIFLMGGAIIIVLIVAALLLRPKGASEAEVVVDNKYHTIQLDVLNGSGESKLAQRMTDYLRAHGFDVVEIGNYGSDLQTTMVLDRTGNREGALKVAQSLGVPEDRVIQKIDKTLYLDVSVYIGKDFKTLVPFK